MVSAKLTFKEWTKLPDGDRTQAGKLSIRHLEEEQWHTTQEKEDYIWNEEHSCNNKHIPSYKSSHWINKCEACKWHVLNLELE